MAMGLSFIFCLLAGTIGIAYMNAMHENKLEAEAIKAGYIQKMEGLNKLWVKP